MSIEVRKTTATATPNIEPAPPSRLTPPSTLAAIALSSTPLPAWLGMKPICAAKTTPASAAQTPAATKAPSWTSAIGTPRWRAASRLSPVAWRNRPARLRASTAQMTPKVASTTRVRGETPQPALPASALRPTGSSSIHSPPVAISISPRKRPSVPSVATIEGTPTWATSTPLTAPAAAPVSTQSPIAPGSPTPRSSARPSTTALRPRTEPLETSMLRVRITSMVPKETSMSTRLLARMREAVAAER